MRKLFCLFAVIGLMTSCIKHIEPQYSPEIYSSSFYLNPILDGDSIVSAADTLSLYYDAEEGAYRMDTVYIGDTVMFASTFYTFTSNLTAVELKWETNLMNLWYPLPSGVKEVLTDQTDIDAGKLYFNPGYHRVSFPIYFIPLVGGNRTLKLSVESDSEFPVSSVLLNIPVRPRPEETEE